ncbi:MAG: colanic acid biosynthesis acetyltransferase WcaF [Flavobacterium sp.]|nr:MAG: colanic acid biosynthesis acetyltransferase WcaF [Flavobacterium sp.]
MFELEKFNLPKNFRGRSAIVVQLWRVIYVVFFRNSPQFLYGWRRFILRLFGAKIGKKVIIRPSAEITYPWKIEIGDYSWIGDNVVLYSLGRITIGSNTIVSQKSYLCTGSHDINSVAFDIFEKPIVIGNSCWIATDVFIAPGVQIVDEVIVGARSSVFKSIVTKGIYKGNPVAKKEV